MQVKADTVAPVVFHVLVAEDSQINIKLLQRYLNLPGLQIWIGENGQLVVDKYKEEQLKREAGNPTAMRFCCVLLDINMPVMGGVQACQQLLELDCKIPIIAMTANVLARDQHSYKAAGMSGILSKPFNRKDILKQILACLVTSMSKQEHEVLTRNWLSASLTPGKRRLRKPKSKQTQLKHDESI
jgi:CheY-like chemotaxis protein